MSLSNNPSGSQTNITQEYNDVKDKLADLIPWLERLLVTLAKVNPNDDRDEVERRSELTKSVSRPESLAHPKLIPNGRSLEDIGKRSLALSEKGKVARVLDKTQDSGEVIKLVEELRRAILVYQVGVRQRRCRKSLTRGTDVAAAVDIQPGRPFDCEFLPPVFDFGTKLMAGRLKLSFDALLKLHQVRERVWDQSNRITRLQTSPVKDKIESVRAWLDRLGAQGDVAKNVDEFRRRENLYGCVLSILRRTNLVKPAQSS